RGRQVLELLQPCDVALERFTASARPCPRNGIGSLYDGRDQARHLDLVVMRPDRIADVRVLFVLLAQLHTDDGVRAFDLFLDHLSDVVEQAGTACFCGVQIQLGRNEGRDTRRFDGVSEQVLAVAGAIPHPSDHTDQLGMQAVQVEVDHRPFARFDDLFFDLRAYLLNDFLDPGRGDASVLDQLQQRQPGDLASDRIKTGQDDRLGRVVYDHLDARCRLEGPDVSTFTPDNAAFHFVRLNVHDRDGVLD